MRRLKARDIERFENTSFAFADGLVHGGGATDAPSIEGCLTGNYTMECPDTWNCEICVFDSECCVVISEHAADRIAGAGVR